MNFCADKYPLRRSARRTALRVMPRPAGAQPVHLVVRSVLRGRACQLLRPPGPERAVLGANQTGNECTDLPPQPQWLGHAIREIPRGANVSAIEK